ncbi:MAG: hypothetical protein KDK78_12495, partial [Chlamydiia bacterium]|nr:hypothetical protein [Chlamydiia bacterium]
MDEVNTDNELKAALLARTLDVSIADLTREQLDAFSPSTEETNPFIEYACDALIEKLASLQGFV